VGFELTMLVLIGIDCIDSCEYKITTNSPYVCHPHAMLVFPTLSQDLREQWEILEGRLINEEITNKVC
jgi:N-acetylglucosamine-1-phosphate transferase gamma subunit